MLEWVVAMESWLEEVDVLKMNQTQQGFEERVGDGYVVAGAGELVDYDYVHSLRVAAAVVAAVVEVVFVMVAAEEEVEAVVVVAVEQLAVDVADIVAERVFAAEFEEFQPRLLIV